MTMKRPEFAEETDLVDVHEGDEVFLVHRFAAEAWRKMKAAAARDGINIYLVSSFRSILRQRKIIQKKLDAGQALDEILKVNTAPGQSEHHTGRALDLNTPGCPVLEEDFAETSAFSWLTQHAADYGFTLSYPPDNPHQVIYEPWHWCWHSQN